MLALINKYLIYFSGVDHIQPFLTPKPILGQDYPNLLSHCFYDFLFLCICDCAVTTYSPRTQSFLVYTPK